ncbi:unnamed protein product (macronuclear) [Paramecium tetraurelia]|uniref:Uncharacterized protein n=1 Tax=Paramecium tetraurelia TaxID=5888 RepID=A0DJM5_PARTE|nr:uncharacterized protein GSPATT00017586001 [Paramecium tetraurelia]CAK83242.1 unnamed protein product [Paramecium tetraurelia]|eukprot:XP_001450639.1 hypothetical protein (macronuclear) [Paramecium tetraurelia strain d4-2]
MSAFKTLIKMPQNKLASKCIALEELLQRYYQFEEVHYDLQSKYQILQEKFEKLSQQNLQLKQSISNDKDSISQKSYKKLDSYLNCTEKIELCAIEDLETQKLIEELKQQNQKMKEEVSQSKKEYQRLQSMFEQTQTELVRSASLKTASDSKYNSLIDDKSNDSVQSYKNEIARLNKIVISLVHSRQHL